MGELIVVLAPLALLALVAIIANYVPLQLLASVALGLIAVGTAFGVPCGITYHVVLRRELLRQGSLPKRWLWQPQQQHERLDHAALARVRLWFLLGGLGFMLIVSGALLGALALALWFRAGGFQSS